MMGLKADKSLDVGVAWADGEKFVAIKFADDPEYCYLFDADQAEAIARDLRHLARELRRAEAAENN